MERREEVRVYRLDIRQVNGLVQQHLVEGHREAAVNVMPMEYGNA
jgi:hypothetical protein